MKYPLGCSDLHPLGELMIFKCSDLKKTDSHSEYDQLIQSCDVGLIFLDQRFTIPNFPSRLLSYIEYKMPVIAATDPNTDLGKIMEENGFGLWAKSGDVLAMNQSISKFESNQDLIRKMGAIGFDYMHANYTVLNSYSKILSHFKSSN